MSTTDSINKKLKYAKNISISKNYIALYTGKSALLYDKQLNLINEYAKLDYVYDGYFSDDEKYLLLVGAGNVIHIVSLSDLSIKRHRIPSPYNRNLEGIACWAYDSDIIILPLMHNSEAVVSTIRRIDSIQTMEYTDFLICKYWISKLTRVESLKQYFALGTDRTTHKTHFLWWDDNWSISSYEVHVPSVNDHILSVEIDEKRQIIIATDLWNHLIALDFYGNPIDAKVESAHQTPILPKNVIELIGDEIVRSVLSSAINPEMLYIGTSEALLIINRAEPSKVTRTKIKFGVHKIHEFQNNVLIIETWSGLRVIDISNV